MNVPIFHIFYSFLLMHSIRIELSEYDTDEVIDVSMMPGRTVLSENFHRPLVKYHVIIEQTQL